MARFGKLTLRDLFWLLLLAAVAVGWWLERSQAKRRLVAFLAQYPMSTQSNFLNESFLQRQKLLGQLRGKTSQELIQRFRNTKPATPFGATDEYCCCLLEMARRKMRAELQAEYDKLMKSRPMPPHDELANAYLLTALRRAHGRPDPIEIELELNGTQAEVHGNTGFVIPAVIAKLRNIDSEPIGLTRGGDYRSGRQTRWRMQLTDARGVRVADSNFPQFAPGGGISSFGALDPGQIIEVPSLLDGRNYVKSPRTGNYQLEVFYGETEIAAEGELSGLIVWKSKPIKVLVENHNRALEQRISAQPLIIILLVGGMLLWWRQQRSRRKLAARGESLPPWVTRRDLVALCLLIALMIGWKLDTEELYTVIEQLRPDTKARWTMKLLNAN